MDPLQANDPIEAKDPLQARDPWVVPEWGIEAREARFFLACRPRAAGVPTASSELPAGVRCVYVCVRQRERSARG